MKKGNIFNSPDLEFDLVNIKHIWSDMFFAKTYYPYGNKRIRIRLADYFERILLPANPLGFDFVLLKRRNISPSYELEINTAVAILINILDQYQILPQGFYFSIPYHRSLKDEYGGELRIDLTLESPTLPEVIYDENKICMGQSEFLYPEVYWARHGKLPIQENGEVFFSFTELTGMAI